MKKCRKCKIKKSYSEYYSKKDSKDGLYSMCKICARAESLAIKRSKEGVITQLYSHQKSNSKKRGHLPPAYTKSDLRDWLMAQKKFHHMFHLWEVSGFDNMLIPSVDRLDNTKGYTFSNLELVVWKENKRRAHEDSKTTKLSTGNTKVPVIQLTKKGKIVASYISQHEASRITGIHRGNISSCCRGDIKTAGGYIWKMDL